MLFHGMPQINRFVDEYGDIPPPPEPDSALHHGDSSLLPQES